MTPQAAIAETRAALASARRDAREMLGRARTNMKTLISNYRPLCPVSMPEWRGRQKYMHSFDLSDPAMAEGYEDYLQPVKVLCAAAEGEAK